MLQDLPLNKTWVCSSLMDCSWVHIKSHRIWSRTGALVYTTCLKLLAVLYLYLVPKSDFTFKDTWWGSVLEKNSHLLGKTVSSVCNIIQAVWKCDFLLSVIHFYQDLDDMIIVKCECSAFSMLDIIHIKSSHALNDTSLSQCNLYCYSFSFS